MQTINSTYKIGHPKTGLTKLDTQKPNIQKLEIQNQTAKPDIQNWTYKTRHTKLDIQKPDLQKWIHENIQKLEIQN